jgi:hypothetical protein
MSPSAVGSLLDEAWRLEPFVPPFVFSAFFSPEDTLLCVCAAEAARVLLPGGSSDTVFRVAELTSGSGLVGLHLLRADPSARLLGLDIDAEAATIAGRNAEVLDLTERARFVTADLWAPTTIELLKTERPQLLVCNPPYVPEPPGRCMQIEAGAGPHGTAHILRALELARDARPQALALSWCSLADPARVVAAADAAGYDLHRLYVAAISDGEYSGSVHSYLRELGDCYINEQPDTLSVLASDGCARFGYLLLAGAFARRELTHEKSQSADRDAAPAGVEQSWPADGMSRHNGAAAVVQRLCKDFERDGVNALSAYAETTSPFPIHCSVLDRWAELSLRAMLHGEISRAAAKRS